MHKILLAMLVCACSTNDVDTTPPTPGTGWEAAHDLADAICQRLIACDPSYTLTLDQCIEYKAPNLCKPIGCDAPYDRTDALDMCIADYNATTCDVEPVSCEL